MLYLLLCIIYFLIIYFWARRMERAAIEKGYRDDGVFAWCFWTGLFGALYVIALPDKNVQEQNKKIIEQFSNPSVKNNDSDESLPPL